MSILSLDKPLFGRWKPGPIVHNLYYGSGCISKHLRSSLPSPNSRVFVVTGKTVAWDTPLVDDLRQVLGDNLAGVFTQVQPNVPIDGVFDAVDMMVEVQGEDNDNDDNKIDVILAVGGGSPIDFAKILSVQARANPNLGPFKLIAIPTTLSAAECTIVAFYMRDGARKLSYTKPAMAVDTIFYDAEYAQYTPKRQWLSSGICALDHAVETMYDPFATEFPAKAMAKWAVKGLFEDLRDMAADWPGTRDQMTRLFLAAHASNSMRSVDMIPYNGLSHLFSYALSSPYKIPCTFLSLPPILTILFF